MPRQRALWNKLDEYFDVLERSALSDKSVEDYYYFAELFVRWTEGSFAPGEGNRRGSREGLLPIFAERDTATGT